MCSIGVHTPSLTLYVFCRTPSTHPEYILQIVFYFEHLQNTNHVFCMCVVEKVFCKRAKSVHSNISEVFYTICSIYSVDLEVWSNLLNAPVSSVMRQNACVILTATGSVQLYSVDLEVWSKLAERKRIKRQNFDCDWERVNTFSHCVTLTHALLLQIISYSDTKVPVLVVTEYKCASVLYVYELIFSLHTSRSTEYSTISHCITLTNYLLLRYRSAGCRCCGI